MSTTGTAPESARSRRRLGLRGRVASVALGVALTTGLVAGVGLPAQAAVPSAAQSQAVLAVASQYVGTPYRYGGSTPAGFDCSGYTKYVFAKMGIALPHSANIQMRNAARVGAGQAVPGDLVFFVSGNSAYHVGVYAGNGKLFDAPNPGGRVTERAIWTSKVVYGRVLA